MKSRTKKYGILSLIVSFKLVLGWFGIKIIPSGQFLVWFGIKIIPSGQFLVWFGN